METQKGTLRSKTKFIDHMEQTVLVKRSIEKDGNPKQNGDYHCIMSDFHNNDTISFRDEEWHLPESYSEKGRYIKYWYEEVSLDQLIESSMPTDLEIDEEFPTRIFASTNVERNKRHDNLMVKKGIEWLKNKLTDK